MTPLEFATQKLAEGVEILCRNNRLRIWPGRAFRHFTSAELAFINDHKEELKAIAVAKTLPETQVVWKPPTAVGLTTELRVPGHDTRHAGSVCAYCHGPCVGSQHPHYATLHYNDPSEIAARSKRATAVMVQQWRRR